MLYQRNDVTDRDFQLVFGIMHVLVTVYHFQKQSLAFDDPAVSQNKAMGNVRVNTFKRVPVEMENLQNLQ